MTRSPNQWLLILNGKAAGNAEVREAVELMRQQGIALAVRVTWETGDEARYVQEAIDAGMRTIVAGGGDGSLSAVAAALARHDVSAHALPSLGLIPLGTANDFATAAWIPNDPAQALRLIADTPAQTIDLLRLTTQNAGPPHWAANLISGGFGTQVTVEANDTLKKLLGGLAYFITGIGQLGKIEPVTAQLDGPGFAWSGEFIALGIGNGRQAGGGQPLCPDALIDDGLLDLTIVPPLAGELGSTVSAWLSAGKEAALDQVAVRTRLPWLRIQSPQAMMLNLDGEPVESTVFHIECIARRLHMHLPIDCPLLSRPGTPLPAGQHASTPLDDGPPLAAVPA